MEKYLITFTSSNRITGPIMVTTSPRSSCPLSCPLRKDQLNQCYAERGHLGGRIWSGLDRTDPGETFGNGVKVYTFEQLLIVIGLLAPGQMWRHNQAGDLPTVDGIHIDDLKLDALVQANRGRRCFTFTHHDPFNDHNKRAIKKACEHGFMINLSADSLEEADRLADLDIAPVAVVVDPNQKENMTTPKGRKVAICPARLGKGITCSTCQICTKKHKAIIAFPRI